ncbi:MAG: 4-fold beta flower protein [Anaerolineales bacterium]|jgi:hypothetical protein
MPPANKPPAPVHLFTSRGDFSALVSFPYLYNAEGEWIGWVSERQEVFNLEGKYVGWLSEDHRILRRRSVELGERTMPPPAAPQLRKIHPPAVVPLPPLMTVYSHDVMDVLEERPSLLHTRDTGETKPDMD